jgi:glycosyltransferase involved in cell wall biosynthesis
MKTRVLLLIRELHLGGSERQMTEIARGLDRSRFEPHVGCFRAEGIRGDELRAAGVPVVQFPVHSFMSPSALKGAVQLTRYIRRHEIRVVHTFDYPLTTFAVPVARAATRAVVISSQRAHRELIPGIYASLVPMTDRFADAIVVNCEFLQRHLIEDYSVPGARIRLCYNGIDLERFHPGPSPRPEALPAGSPVIGVVCALRPEKGLLTLIDAFAKVCALTPALKLAIVGSGEMLPRLRARAAELGIDGSCVFQPATQSVADWLRAIDIFVLPSLSEALSNSLMEAMACGCCAVASDTGGNPELIAAGERGLLFERGNADALAAALRQLIENPPLRQRLAANGARFLRENFSLAASARRMGDIYTELLETR